MRVRPEVAKCQQFFLEVYTCRMVLETSTIVALLFPQWISIVSVLLVMSSFLKIKTLKNTQVERRQTFF